MKVLKSREELNLWLESCKDKNLSIGFVPTMGALHQGHLNLVKQALETSQVVLVSIFVNPKQFNNATDFEKYPNTIEQDIKKLRFINCHAVFVPSFEDIYPKHKKDIKLDLGILNTQLEGKHRPGHFDGVVQVVHNFLEMVKPNTLFLGLKDFQQCKVIELLCAQYFKEIKINFCLTTRDTNGLAMSSRNMRLSDSEYQNAAVIYKALNSVKALFEQVIVSDALNYAKNNLKSKGLKVEYIELVHYDSFKPSKKWLKKGKNVVLIAAFMGEVRLIDNIIF